MQYNLVFMFGNLTCYCFFQYLIALLMFCRVKNSIVVWDGWFLICYKLKIVFWMWILYYFQTLRQAGEEWTAGGSTLLWNIEMCLTGVTTRHLRVHFNTAVRTWSPYLPLNVSWRVMACVLSVWKSCGCYMLWYMNPAWYSWQIFDKIPSCYACFFFR
jgi:hypothetical protein